MTPQKNVTADHYLLKFCIKNSFMPYLWFYFGDAKYEIQCQQWVSSCRVGQKDSDLVTWLVLDQLQLPVINEAVILLPGIYCYPIQWITVNPSIASNINVGTWNSTAQIPDARSPSGPNIVRWYLLPVGSQYRTWFMSFFWHLEFLGGFWILGKYVHPSCKSRILRNLPDFKNWLS